MKNILIVRTDRIGDVILTLPLASIIKREYPDGKVTFLLRDYTKTLGEFCVSADNSLAIKTIKGKVLFFENLKMLKDQKFDAAVIAFPNFMIALILFLSGIKIRIGTGYRWYSFLFNKKVFQHRKTVEMHELEYNIKLLEPLGIKTIINRSSVDYNIHIPSQIVQKASEELTKFKIDPQLKTIIIHPGSGGSAFDVPLTWLKELISLMASKLKINIIITGSESENNLCKELIINDRIINLSGKLKLEDLFVLIKNADILIANSTGPLHIAAALGKYVIGFYPKVLVCSSKRWGPYTNKSFVFEPEIECSDCTIEQCKKLNCMNSIRMEKVLEKVEEFLAECNK